ncbi:MAG: Uma2 family endonuclease [Chloroflexota bacterium]
MVTSRHMTSTDWLADIPNDTEEAPWMVMPDYQLWALHLLLSILRRHRAERRLRWYIGAELWVTLPRPSLPNLEVAPDLFVAEGDTRRRTSWNVREEGQPPRFVLEIVTGASWLRDTTEKVALYELLGVEEYAIFAPLRQDDGPKLFGYHRGVFGRWEGWPSDGGGLRSRALGGLLLKVAEEDDSFVRLYDGRGRRLLSDAEAAEDARAREDASRRQAAEARRHTAEARRRAVEERQRVAEERQRATTAEAARDAEARRAAAEAERAREAEARVAALEAELARLRRDQ